ncbi:MAG TPA: cytochrome c [Allosphingosinicella sp.]|nr:cytochrome c [Allosphingosinicella sp.]
MARTTDDASRASAWPLLFVLASILILSGCDREARDYRGRPLPETGPTAGDPRGAAYESNAFQLAQGQRLFGWMNCVGCHAHGGGGMGPPLMDDEWRYGGSMEEIAATILFGRPNGMPAFQQRITEQQAWQLAAFVRALSAQPRQDALPGRADELRNTEPLTLDERKPIRRATPKADDSSEE